MDTKKIWVIPYLGLHLHRLLVSQDAQWNPHAVHSVWLWIVFSIP